MAERRDLFGFMVKRIGDVAAKSGLHPPQAFIKWFVDLYYLQPHDLFISDGSLDGKVDAFFTTHNGSSVTHHIVNSKFTKTYDKIAPQSFYNEISFFSGAFLNKGAREPFLEKAVKTELRAKYRQLFDHFDQERAQLLFVTNHRRNDKYYTQVVDSAVQIFHLEDLLQYLIDDIDGAMPRTAALTLSSIQTVLAADRNDTEASTSIVFARLTDFIRYMRNDPYDLLFVRNVRIAFSPNKSPVNRAIQDTFRDHPKEFAYSNNGITILCEKHRYDPGPKELTLENPRVVNGSQTLHMVRDIPNPSINARVMVRIIEIPPISDDDLPSQVRWKRDVVARIAVRSNQQNPIKKWNLVSNDDFQLKLFRHFRQEGYFYERRDREWASRSRELKSAGILKGPTIKKMAQLIASYYWGKKNLGPANAKDSVGELFEREAYDKIRDTSTELAFQLFMINENIQECYDVLAKSRKYIGNLRGHINLALMALVFLCLRQAGARFGNPNFSQFLKGQWDDGRWYSVHMRQWQELAKQATDHIASAYKKEDKASRAKKEEPLNYNNFFKSSHYVDNLVKSGVSASLKKAANQVLKS